MVHFVGAGSGAADLITVRGSRLLGEADVIIYAGSLVNPELLQYKKEGCAVYDSAKMTLEEVLAVIDQAEAAGKTTVRLHTGDPCVYGAIREQMDVLEEKGIAYDYCPGVSAFCGAASALKMEYTLPGISQTVIITRMAGRTPVPEREEIAKLASHGSTMVIFLSTGMLEKLSEQLMAGGYAADTPAAIVYKATWPEEESHICTVSTLAQCAKEYNITKTALIIVGDTVAQSGYNRSELYHPAFTTEFRQRPRSGSRSVHPTSPDGGAKAKADPFCGEEENQKKETGEIMKKAGIAYFTEQGGRLAHRIADGLAPEYEILLYEKGLKDWCAACFAKAELIIFIGACGIAVRTIAPLLKSKTEDPAVLVLDEAGQYVISLLSGHIGGANAYAQKIAGLTGATPVITTASDVRGKNCGGCLCKEQSSDDQQHESGEMRRGGDPAR